MKNVPNHQPVKFLPTELQIYSGLLDVSKKRFHILVSMKGSILPWDFWMIMQSQIDTMWYDGKMDSQKLAMSIVSFLYQFIDDFPYVSSTCMESRLGFSSQGLKKPLGAKPPWWIPRVLNAWWLSLPLLKTKGSYLYSQWMETYEQTNMFQTTKQKKHIITCFMTPLTLVIHPPSEYWNCTWCCSKPIPWPTCD